MRERTRRRIQRFRERTRVVVIIALLALALLQQPVQAQLLEQEHAAAMTAQALPYPNPRDQNCASGYTSSHAEEVPVGRKRCHRWGR
jgi:hypothetical protein